MCEPFLGCFGNKLDHLSSSGEFIIESIFYKILASTTGFVCFPVG